jgi:hypothetical protein
MALRNFSGLNKRIRNVRDKIAAAYRHAEHGGCVLTANNVDLETCGKKGQRFCIKSMNPSLWSLCM